MSKEKLSKELSAKFADYLKLRKAAKDTTNELNREKTVLKNFFKDGIKNRQFEVGTHVITGGYRFDYNQTQTDVIDVEDFFKLYEDGEITREQLLRCISVGKAAVDTHVGSDITLRLAQTKTGKDFDVRITELGIDDPREEVIVTPTAAIVRKKNPLKKPVAQAPAKPVIRRVRLSTKK